MARDNCEKAVADGNFEPTVEPYDWKTAVTVVLWYGGKLAKSEGKGWFNKKKDEAIYNKAIEVIKHLSDRNPYTYSKGYEAGYREGLKGAKDD